MVLGRFFKLDQGVEKTRGGLFGRISELFSREEIDEDLWDELEENLLGSDVGLETTELVMKNLRYRVSIEAVKSPRDLRRAIQEELVDILDIAATDDPLVSGPLTVVLVVGVNGVGKTTSIAKLAKLWKDQRHGVVLAAADTFRAAAADQLDIWANRAGVQIVSHQPGADPGSVTFDAIAAAKARGADVVIVDTAGRLHTKVNLMEELRKIRRVVDKHQVPRHKTLLILDATTGQNGLQQAKSFLDVSGVDGVIITKLDGTARGGIVFSIVKELEVPVLFVGTGEKLD
ncbi:MAG TPA: signal recognition particle-docking protein FtsY, partial [Candidatus Limnocylindria bacterium]|nr:signal recognition particle-docking protein FtsY [Candidatus Limnocylindria bacterium]